MGRTLIFYIGRYGLVIKELDSQSRGPKFETTGWLQGWLSLSSLRGRLNEYQEILGTEW